MRRLLILIICLVMLVFIFSACNNEQPYNQYMQAYQQLMSIDSFVLERNSTLNISESIANTLEKTSGTSQETYYVINNKGDYEAIANFVSKTSDNSSTDMNIYYCDGYEYDQNITDQNENYRIKRDNDFAINIATEGIINFPKKVIAKQIEQDTSDGSLLTFELDSEKYYAYYYTETYKQYGYGGFSTFREPPVYTVHLDKQGRIKEVSGHFCTVNSDSTAFTWDQSYTITFTQYGGVKLDFPELNNKDYPEIQEPSSD